MIVETILSLGMSALVDFKNDIRVDAERLARSRFEGDEGDDSKIEEEREKAFRALIEEVQKSL